MIAKLTGSIDSFHDGFLILDVGGVGYQVFASARTLASIGQKGEVTSLLIDTHIREDHFHLYGFPTAAEQSWFRLLTSVQGVGAKAALSILNTCPPDRLSLAIAAQDKTALRQADGIGPKIATRILTELKDKAGKMDLSPTAVAVSTMSQVATESAPISFDQDAVSALINLGYARSDAYAAVMQASAKANDNEKQNLQDIIRLALKELSV